LNLLSFLTIIKIIFSNSQSNWRTLTD
jgi:hypothetical protein